jgi:hypothetical protein
LREILYNSVQATGGAVVNTEALKVAVQALERLALAPAMKDQERIFFSLCYGLRDAYRPREIVNLLADTIPHKRCWYYLEKWAARGFYSYGVTLDLGWFYPEKLPDRYRQIVAAQEPERLLPREKIGKALDILLENILVDETNPHALLDRAREELAKMPGGPYPVERIVGIDLSMAAFMDDKTESGLLEDDL